MEEDDKNRRDIEEILNQTVNFLDLRTPYSEEFYRTLDEASAHIEEALYSKRAGYSELLSVPSALRLEIQILLPPIDQSTGLRQQSHDIPN